MLGKEYLVVVISDSGNLSFLTFCNEMHRFYLFLLSSFFPGQKKEMTSLLLCLIFYSRLVLIKLAYRILVVDIGFSR